MMLRDAHLVTPGDIDDVLASILRGSAGVEALGSLGVDAVQHRARHHGVVALLADCLRDASGISSQLACWLRQEAYREAAFDMVREREIRTMLSALADAAIVPLLLKGVHAAYRWYPRPDLRPRVDTDVFVQRDDRWKVDEVLRGLGYECPAHSGGELLMYQAPYVKRRGDVLVHVVDVHWRVANPQAFGGVLICDELVRDAVPVPRLGRNAYALSPVDALLLACVHRVAHHFDSNRLIWLYDIHLIASDLAGPDWERFLQLVAQRNVGTVCRWSLERTVQRFGTALPDAVRHDARLTSPAGDSATAAYVRRRRHVHNVIDDLLALGTWRERVRLMREHLFPSRRYMREVYAGESRAPLLLLYAGRAVRGARRWFAPSAPVGDRH